MTLLYNNGTHQKVLGIVLFTTKEAMNIGKGNKMNDLISNTQVMAITKEVFVLSIRWPFI